MRRGLPAVALLASSCSLVIDLPNLPLPFCGDGMVSTAEDCDDGNDVPGDGCNPPCKAPLEYSVNTTRDGDQGNPHLAFFTSGASFVTFDDGSAEPPDTDTGGAVRARHFDAEGRGTGADFVLPQATSGEQEHTDLAAAEVAIVVWDDFSGAPPDIDRGVRARVFAQNGGAIGSDFVVNETLPGEQCHPAVAAGSGGSFLVVWFDDSLDEVHGRLLDSTGAPKGAELALSEPASIATASPPAVAFDGARFLVVWAETAADTQATDLRARFVRLDGGLGAPFLVSSTRSDVQDEPALAFAPGTGRFLAVWTDESGVDDPDSSGIRARLIVSENNFVGPDFPLNEVVAGSQEVPSVAASNTGTFLAVWSTSDDSDVHGRRIGSDGTLRDADTVFNTITLGSQKDADVAFGPNGFRIVWEDESQLPPETADEGIRGLLVPAE